MRPSQWFPLLVIGLLMVGSPAGAATRVRQFPIPNPFSDPFGITAGPDGNLWFTEGYADEIGRITPAGVITQFHIPPRRIFPDPWGITAGPDEDLWVTEE